MVHAEREKQARLDRHEGLAEARGEAKQTDLMDIIQTGWSSWRKQFGDVSPCGESQARQTHKFDHLEIIELYVSSQTSVQMTE